MKKNTVPKKDVAEEQKSIETEGFVIEKSKSVEWQRLQWVLRARSIDEYRSAINGVHIDSEANMVATDGMRLHIWRNCPIKQTGYFQVIATARAVFLIPKEDQFPNWQRIIPKKQKQNDGDFSLPADRKKSGFASAIYNLAMKTKTCFNISYLVDLTSYKDAVWKVYGNDSEKAWVFRCQDMEALIMPISQDFLVKT